MVDEQDRSVRIAEGKGRVVERLLDEPGAVDDADAAPALDLTLSADGFRAIDTRNVMALIRGELAIERYVDVVRARGGERMRPAVEEEPAAVGYEVHVDDQRGGDDFVAEGQAEAELVRPGFGLDEHGHPEGEEIFVIEGTFSDHLGDAHAGTHLLNPEGFRHAPHSEPGCLILVSRETLPLKLESGQG